MKISVKRIISYILYIFRTILKDNLEKIYNQGI